MKTKGVFVGMDGYARIPLSLNNKLGLVLGTGSGSIINGIFYENQDGNTKKYNAIMLTKLNVNIMLLQREVKDE